MMFPCVGQLALLFLSSVFLTSLHEGNIQSRIELGNNPAPRLRYMMTFQGSVHPTDAAFCSDMPVSRHLRRLDATEVQVDGKSVSEVLKN